MSKHKFATAISYLFHPLFMPTIGLMYLYYSAKLDGFNTFASLNQKEDNWIFISVVIIFTLIIPAITALVLKKTEQIESLKMQSREERYVPFTITSAGILLSIVLLFGHTNVYVNPVIKIFYIGCFLSIFITLMITYQWKVSIHMVGIGGFTGAIYLTNSINDAIPPNVFELVVCILLAGLVGYARLSLKAHSMAQVIVGFLLGFTCESFFLWL